jgi:hypothetical protein
MKRSGCLAVLALAIVGCLRTQSEVDVKPVNINLNITGRLELVVTDARRQEEQITGAKAKRTVRPEDIGLPPSPGKAAEGPGAMIDGLERLFAVAGVAYAADSDPQGDVIAQMAARHPKVSALLKRGVVGESHGGLLVVRGPVSPADEAVVDAENADREHLYKLEAAKKKTTIDQVALGYYLARLEHVDKGTWVERYDKASGSWQWFQWDR